MKLFTKDSDYAVRALQYMAKNQNGPMSSTELSESLSISWSFLRKILFILQKNGIVRSNRGRLGGFDLVVNPEKIYLMDVIKMFQGEFSLTTCVINGKACQHIEYCVLRKKLLMLEQMIVDELKDETLKNLLEKEMDVLRTFNKSIASDNNGHKGDR